ncbi:Gfo/Idh/MocA family protein [Dongshaea marina]|uniref:Gfo/Idh/MocA family protein n=1 Tax=Dongshaea marina TaxID=2047966 RepID=UPI000D3EC412|nr:Gfo/Idh/MocA family oxidoreductase [Dongshaea marina]
MSNHKISWGIAGLGKIAQRFANDLILHSPSAELKAVASRDMQRSAEFANRNQCQRAYASYIEMARDPDIDIVYVATIHPFHQPLVELFLNHGKHVLVEKPAFTNHKDWLTMSELAKKQGVLLVEAMKSMAFPAYRQLRSWLQEKKLKINRIEAAFGNYHAFDDKLPIFNHRLSGGATLDVGIYPLWLYCDICKLMQVQPQLPRFECWIDNPGSQVDETVSFTFDGPVQGTLSASITRDLRREATLQGENLHIVIHDKWWNPKKITVTHLDETFEIEPEACGGGFQYEIEHLSGLISDGKNQSSWLPAQTSQQVLSLIESSLKAHGFSHLVYPNRS